MFLIVLGMSKLLFVKIGFITLMEIEYWVAFFVRRPRTFR
jgi:hypothetical protein